MRKSKFPHRQRDKQNGFWFEQQESQHKTTPSFESDFGKLKQIIITYLPQMLGAVFLNFIFIFIFFMWGSESSNIVA